MRTARWDCAAVCKGEKRSEEDRKRKSRESHALATRGGSIFKGNPTSATNAELKVWKEINRKEREALEQKEVPVPKVEQAETLWYQRWDEVVKQAERLGTKATLDECRAEAGLSMQHWHSTFKKAKEEIPDEVQTLFEQQGWELKQRKKRAKKEKTEVLEETEELQEASEGSDPPTLSEAMGNAYDWLHKLQGDELRRAFIGLGILLGFDEITRLMPLVEVRAAAAPQEKKKIGRPRKK